MGGIERYREKVGWRVPGVASRIASRQLPEALIDSLFLALIVILSLIGHIGALGFYSDDWALLARLETAPRRSFVGYYTALQGDATLKARPVESALWIARYALFGIAPLGYHLVDAAAVMLGAVLIALVLREMHAPRYIAVSGAAIYALLPSYTTDRLWVAAGTIAVSFVLCLFSPYAMLRAMHPALGRGTFQAWTLAAASSFMLGGLAYEVTVPLALLALPYLWFHQYRAPGTLANRVGWRRLIVLTCSVAPLVLLLIIFKLLTSVRTGIHVNYLTHMARVIVGGLSVNYGTYGLGLPYAAAWLAYTRASPGTLGTGLVLACAVGGYLAQIMRRPAFTWPTVSYWAGTIIAGGVVVACGHIVFLFTEQGQLFSSTGPGNRVAIAAAPGAALSFVGVIGWLSGRLSTKARPAGFCLAVTLTCLSGSVIQGSVADDWTAAYDKQQLVLADIRHTFPVLTPESAILLDGVCPYIGSAVVFESNWDLAGALMVAYHDPTLNADIVTPRLQVEDAGIVTRIYGTVAGHYSYNQYLFIYDASRRFVQSVPDAATGYRYFPEDVPRQGPACPPGEPGYSTPILPRFIAPFEPRR